MSKKHLTVTLAVLLGTALNAMAGGVVSQPINDTIWIVQEPDGTVHQRRTVSDDSHVDVSHQMWVDSIIAGWGAEPQGDSRSSYARRRGMIDRESVKTVFIPKGQWMLGGQVSWTQWDKDNLNYLVLKDINFEGHSFAAGPYFGYFFANNLAVGARFSYKRYYMNLGEFDLNLGDDFNIGLKDLYYLQHDYKTTAFLRSYLPIGKSKIFGLLGELQLNYTFSEGKNSTGREETFTGVYERMHNLELGLGGGMTVFVTNSVAAEVMMNVGGYRVKWGKQNTNSIETGSSTTSGANFRINLFSVKFGITYYL